MNTGSFRTTRLIRPTLGQRWRFGFVTRLCPLPLLLAVPAAVLGQTYEVADGQVTITGWNCLGQSEVTIPETINGLPVTRIGHGAFQGTCDTYMTRITIPNSVTDIGEYAFQDCTRLTGITLGKGVTRIGDLAFEGCSGLTSVTIPDRVTTLVNGAFAFCDNLTGVYFKGPAPDLPAGLGSPEFGWWARNVYFYHLPGATGWEP